MLDRAENLLHDHYGGKAYWDVSAAGAPCPPGRLGAEAPGSTGCGRPAVGAGLLLWLGGRPRGPLVRCGAAALLSGRLTAEKEGGVAVCSAHGTLCPGPVHLLHGAGRAPGAA